MSGMDMKEDAYWFVRMNDAAATRQDRESFEQWRDEQPSNQARYELCELAWELTADLADDPALTGEDGASHRRARFGAKMFGAKAAAVAACLVAAVAGVVFSQLYFGRAQIYRTAIGEQHLVRLADGTTAHLNTNTELSIDYSGAARQVRLRHGEVFFKVAKDVGRPFLVHAAAGTVRALGTQFNVRADNDEVTVAVVEGRVRVNAPAGEDEPNHAPRASYETVLMPGDVVSYGPTLEVKKRRMADIRRLVSWQMGRLEFDNTPLAQAVAEINRYFEKPILIDDPKIAKMRITGVFRTGDVRAAVFAIEKFTGASATETKTGIRLVRAN
jgi:transmembrane sensor